MHSLLDPVTQAALQQRLYRYRFLLIYVLIGGASLWVEILLLRGLQYLGVPFLAAVLLGLAAGILFAFWLNARFNFKIPVAKRRRAFAYFVLISAGSAAVNFTFKQQLLACGWSYEGARFVVSGLLFSIAYVFHRRYSFADRKQVGVAVYANGLEDIRGIRGKIGDFPDYIHVDLIDATYASSRLLKNHRF